MHANLSETLPGIANTLIRNIRTVDSVKPIYINGTIVYKLIPRLTTLLQCITPQTMRKNLLHYRPNSERT